MHDVNTLVFVDLPVADTVAAQEFYEQLFGWTINPRPKGVFHQVVPGEGLHLGLFASDQQYPDPKPRSTPERAGLQPRTYILVDDAPQTYLDRALQLGATKAWDEDWWEEFNGYHAAFFDPWGNHIVMWEPKDTRAARTGAA
jgi:predicted enzyme related to lactoylglutathione lyase